MSEAEHHDSRLESSLKHKFQGLPDHELIRTIEAAPDTGHAMEAELNRRLAISNRAWRWGLDADGLNVVVVYQEDGDAS